MTILVVLFSVIVVFVPFATILIASFKLDVGKTLFGAGNCLLRQWETFFGRVETLNCLKNSLIYGAITAIIGIVVAITMSYLLQRTRICG